ncbi:hypothetical protein ACN5O8_03380 [Aliarcobacter butzleri]|uniref:hypothetical protein n=1 Tax=Aliarcobacter butzleri TaxID=28197 RepID=UPI003AF9CB9F
MSKQKIFTLIIFLIFTSMFFSSYALFYNQVYYNFPSDLKSHIGFIEPMVNGKMFVPHPMFHYIIYFFHKITAIDINLVAIAFNAFLVLLLAIIIYQIIALFSKSDFKNYIKITIVLLVMYSGTFFIPEVGFTKYQYLGNGSISVWHNVTMYMVYPFAFLGFFIFFYAIERKYHIGLLILSFIFVILSIFAKPSFIVVFMPMVVIFLIYQIYKDRQINKTILIFVLFLVLVSILILYYQATGTYGSEEKSRIILAPFKVWKLYSDNILVSLIVANLFLIIFFLTSYKYLSIRTIFAFIMFIGAIILFLFFAEEGPRFSHGNFSWSYILIMKLVYFSAIIDYINNYNTISKLNKIILNTALLIHVICGVSYFIIIFSGGSYL